MSETYLETMGLHNIDSIDITGSNLGKGINDRFENIGYNFNKILKSEYLRGHSGSNMSTVVCNISDSANELEDVFYYSRENSAQIPRLTNLTKSSIKNMIYNKLREQYKEYGDINNIWLNKLFQNSSTIYFITENDSEGNKYIKASLPYHIVDPDLISKYKDLYNTNDTVSAVGFVDRSCVIYFDTQNDDGCLDVKIYDNMPTIYYDASVKDFCWKINGERTGISAKGIPGQKGMKGSSFLLGLFTYSETNNPKTNNPDDGYNTLHSIYMVNNNGAGKWYKLNNPEDPEDMSELLGIVSLDHGAPIMAIGLKENATQSDQLTTKVVLGVLRITTDKDGGLEYSVAYNSSSMDIGSIINRADYYDSLYNSEALFLNSRNSGELPIKVAVGNDTYDLGHFIKPSVIKPGVNSQDKQDKHVLSMGLNMYNRNSGANISVMGADSKIQVEDVPDIGITSSLDINYDELNLNGNLKAQNIIAEGSITAQNIDIKSLGNITSQTNIVACDIKASGNLTANDITVSAGGSFGGDLFVGGRIGNTTSKTPLNVNDGICIYNTLGSETIPVQMWQPYDTRRYEVGFYSSHVGLYDSCLNVSGWDETNNDIGIYSRYDIKTDGQLMATNGIDVAIGSGEINLLGPVTLGQLTSDKHNVTGDLSITGGLSCTNGISAKQLNINETITKGLNVGGKLIVNDSLITVNTPTNINNDLNVTGKTEVNNLTVNGSITVKGATNVVETNKFTSNTVLGNGKESVHTIHGKIIINDWVATDAMIKDIFE